MQDVSKGVLSFVQKSNMSPIALIFYAKNLDLSLLLINLIYDFIIEYLHLFISDESLCLEFLLLIIDNRF